MFFPCFFSFPGGLFFCTTRAEKNCKCVPFFVLHDIRHMRVKNVFFVCFLGLATYMFITMGYLVLELDMFACAVGYGFDYYCSNGYVESSFFRKPSVRFKAVRSFQLTPLRFN